MSEARIPLTRPSLGESEAGGVRAALASGMLVQGARVRAFEEGIAARVSMPHGVAVNTGTTAIHLALHALGLKPGDEVIVPDFCFPSVASAVTFTGATPVLCDVDPNSFNLDISRVEAVLSRKTRAVLAVHQFGVPCGATALEAALPEGVAVVEDAACALGATDDGGPCGGQTALGCFSFHPRKIITTAEGGLVTVRDGALADRLRWLRSHGMRRGDTGTVFQEIGFPGRMSDVHAAIGVAQLDRMDHIIAGRARAAAWYRAALADIPGVYAPAPLWAAGRVYQSLVVRIRGGAGVRDRAIAGLRARAIEATIGTYAIHRQPAFQAVSRFVRGGLAGSALAADEAITLPLWPEMAQREVERVCEALAQVGA